MAVNANNRLVADMDRQSVDATGWQLEKARKSGPSQAQAISQTIEQLRYGLDVVTVRDDEGNTRAVHQATYAAIRRETEGPAELRGHDAGLSAGFDLGYDAGYRAAQQQPAT